MFLLYNNYLGQFCGGPTANNIYAARDFSRDDGHALGRCKARTGATGNAATVATNAAQPCPSARRCRAYAASVIARLADSRCKSLSRSRTANNWSKNSLNCNGMNEFAE
jgi:hypothetical protein